MALPAEEVTPLGPVAALARVVAIAEEAGALPKGRGAETVQEMKATYRAAVLAASRYTPVPLPSSLTLFRARDAGALGAAPEVDFDWGRLCARPITIHTAPGTHHSMVRPPHVEELARVLRGVLE